MSDEQWSEQFDEYATVERFLTFIQGGVGLLNAGLAVDWSPAETRRRMKDPDFRELVETARERRTETIEQRVYELAMQDKPSRWAVELALFCQASERGWRPPTQRVEVNRNVRVDLTQVAATVQAAKELMMAADPAALQPGGALDAIDTTATDAD
jgi:hypothetical protein